MPITPAEFVFTAALTETERFFTQKVLLSAFAAKTPHTPPLLVPERVKDNTLPLSLQPSKVKAEHSLSSFPNTPPAPEVPETVTFVGKIYFSIEKFSEAAVVL